LYPSLHLTPPHAEQPIVLVHAVDALKLCHGGAGIALARGETDLIVASLGMRQLPAARSFLSRLGLRGVDLTRLRDDQVREWLRRQVASAQLVAVRVGAVDTGGSKPLLELRKVVRQIEALLQGKLVAQGRQHKLVAGDDLNKLVDRNRYHVVGQADARAVLASVARQSGVGGVLPELLAKAGDKLSRDWRPPFSPDGLVLLRQIPVLAAHKSVTEAVSPSAIRKLLDEGWVEIVLVDAGMEPVPDADFEVKLPDGQTKTSTTDKKGAARFEGILPGECLVRFPKAKGPVGLA
jgi:hypothetical protein